MMLTRKKRNDFDYEELNTEAKTAVLFLGLAVVIFRLSLLCLVLCLVAIVLWFNSFTIFVACIQAAVCLVLYMVRKAAKRVALKKIGVIK